MYTGRKKLKKTLPRPEKAAKTWKKDFLDYEHQQNWKMVRQWVSWEKEEHTVLRAQRLDANLKWKTIFEFCLQSDDGVMWMPDQKN